MVVESLSAEQCALECLIDRARTVLLWMGPILTPEDRALARAALVEWIFRIDPDDTFFVLPSFNEMRLLLMFDDSDFRSTFCLGVYPKCP